MVDKKHSSPLLRARQFADRLGIGLPILLAPIAGYCPPSLSIAVANAGGLGTCRALLMKPEEIRSWNDEFDRGSRGQFQMNLWIPEGPPVRNAELERHFTVWPSRASTFTMEFAPSMPSCRSMTKDSRSTRAWRAEPWLVQRSTILKRLFRVMKWISVRFSRIS